MAASVGVLYYVGVIPRGGTNGSGGGGAPPPPTSPITGFLVYQPGGTNYSGGASPAVTPAGTGPAVSQPYGVLESNDGMVYRVLLGSFFSSTDPLALQGNFTLVASSVPSFYDLSNFVAGVVRSVPTLGSEVNISATTIGVAAANLTFGFSVSPSVPVAYLAFGTYPTFFSNVTMQGVDVNASMLSSILNVNTSWLLGSLHGIDSNLPSSLLQVVVVNRSISLPDAHQVTGQVQVVITPSNVSAFVSTISNSAGSADVGMVTAAMNALNEELLGVSVVSVGHVTFYFVLGPTELTRGSLSGLVSLDIERSALSLALPPGTNPSISSSGSPANPVFGVTWDRAPIASSGYVSTTVRGLWSVATEAPVTVQAAAIGISLSDAGSALQGMGYSDSGMVSDIATLQNPAVFVLVDPSLIQDPNLTGAYRAFALAIVPNDELALQHSVSLYLTVNGVVYNTSHYLGNCGTSLLPGCPVLVADTVGFGTPATYMPDQLGGLSSPTFVKTSGFLAGTTMKTVGQRMGGYGELIQESPIDVGIYDLGYSNGLAGYNLPSVYLTWGQGPTLEVTNNYTEGLYIPATALTSGWYLDNFDSYIGSVGWSSTTVQMFQSYTSDIQGLMFNGSLPVPGVLVMMDLWTNNSPGQVLASVSGVGTQACASILNLSSTQSCIVANLSLSANSASYVFPSFAQVSTSLTGNATGSNLTTGSCVWIGPLPASCAYGGLACLLAGLCSLSPYHVVNVTVYTCYLVVLGSVESCFPPLPLGSVGSSEVSFTLYWGWSPILTPGSYPVILSQQG
jgi:hypothetical protein